MRTYSLHHELKIDLILHHE